MERLTFDGNFCDIAQCRELPCKYDGNCTQKEVWERLKAYEDAGLSPQACAEAREIEETLSGCDYSISRMVELMKADKDGLIVACGKDALNIQILQPENGRKMSAKDYLLGHRIAVGEEL